MHPAGSTVMLSNPGSVFSGSYIPVNSNSTNNYCGSSIYSYSAPSRPDSARLEGGRNLPNYLNSWSTLGLKSDTRSFTSSISATNFHHLHLPKIAALNQDKVLITKPKKTGPFVNYDVPFRKKKVLKFPKLIVTLQPDEVSKQRFMFMKIDPQVKVYYRSEKNKYMLKFQNTKLGQEAFEKGQEMGLTIEKYFPQRPKPTQPIEYISLERLEIREGKSMKKLIVDYLDKGRKVTVDQLKGKRARLLKPNRERWGWVSMYSEEGGRPLLSQLDENEDDLYL